MGEYECCKYKRWVKQMKKYRRILGRRIKHQREKQLLSVEIVATKMDMLVDDYLDWESGTETPQERQLAKLSCILRSHITEIKAGIPLECFTRD